MELNNSITELELKDYRRKWTWKQEVQNKEFEIKTKH